MVPGYHVRRVEGGFLVQEFDQAPEDKTHYKVVTDKQPDPPTWPKTWNSAGN